MNISSFINGMPENSSNKINNLQRIMDDSSSQNLTLNNLIISNETNGLPSKMKTIVVIMDEIKNIKIVYLNKDEIPLIKIKDKYFLESGERIENYLYNLVKFDDSKFEKCFICKEGQNKYFCKNCNNNICYNCYKNCFSKSHILIDLLKELNKISNYITNIKLIFAECFILTKKKKDNDKIIKRNKIYSFSDEYAMNNEIEEKPMDYTYDITLIEAIIEKVYINYFHYKNIEECYKYLIKYYSINEKLNIKNDTDKENNRTNIEGDSEDINGYIILKYKIKKGDKKVKIFGKKFSEKYKNICKIIYGDKIYNLNEYFEINDSNITILEIKLIKINKIEDTSYMFCGCHSLISIPYISNWNTNKIKNMSKMFYNCCSLISLPDISKFNTNNVTDMSLMFYNCHSLISLPDISKWNTINVTKMNFIFYNCYKLILIPDISGWKTNNVTNMSGIFYNCSLLKSLPDISKWNVDNVINMNSMFALCSSLKSLPDISIWNTSNITKISLMFYECHSLISLPDISKWNINNFSDISGMFFNCSKLNSFPDLSKWNKNSG